MVVGFENYISQKTAILKFSPVRSKISYTHVFRSTSVPVNLLESRKVNLRDIQSEYNLLSEFPFIGHGNPNNNL